MRNLVIVTVIIFLLTSCVSKQRETELLKKIETLEKQLDECKHGAEKLHSRMKISFENKDYESCKDIYSQMEERHPESNLFQEVKTIYKKVIAIEKEEERQAKLKAKKEKEEKLRALKKLKKKYDDVSGITWYKQPYFIHYNNRNLTSLYFGDDGNKIWLRLKMSYAGDDWIFFEKAYLSYDGNTKEVVFDEYDDKETDNGGGVWEWIDVSVSKDLESFLRKFAKSKSAKMRLTGKYTRTRNLTWNERQGIRDVLNGYDALKQGIK